MQLEILAEHGDLLQEYARKVTASRKAGPTGRKAASSFRSKELGAAYRKDLCKALRQVGNRLASAVQELNDDELTAVVTANVTMVLDYILENAEVPTVTALAASSNRSTGSASAAADAAVAPDAEVSAAAPDGMDDAIARFLATEDVSQLTTTLQDVDIPHNLAIGARLKRNGPGTSKRCKKYDYGVVVHIKPSGGITVLWMRDSDALDPEVYEGADGYSMLASFRHNMSEVAKKGAVPQRATYEQLTSCW